MDKRTVEARDSQPNFVASEASMTPTMVLSMTLIYDKCSILYHYDSASPNVITQSVYALDPSAPSVNTALKQRTSQAFIKLPFTYRDKACADAMSAFELITNLNLLDQTSLEQDIEK